MTIGVEAWQSRLSSHSMRLSHLLKSGDISDVVFIVGNHQQQRRFNVHKLILSICSDVFSAMFYGSLPENNEVIVTDITPDIFEITMKYVYEEAFEVSCVEEAIQTYAVSEKYNIALLRDLCVDYMVKEMHPCNIHLLHTIPNLFDELKLKLRCESIMSEHTSEIIKSDSFFRWPAEMIQYMLQINKLNFANETQLFKSCLNWAVAQCDLQNAEITPDILRGIMNPLLPYIRFLAMDSVDFVNIVADSGILDDNEVTSIVMNMIVHGCRPLPSWCSTTKSRKKFVEALSLYEHCTCSKECQPVNGLQSMECKLVVRRGSLLLRGVSFYLSFTVSTKVTISVARQGIILGAGDQTSYNHDTGIMKVFLTEPVTLKRLPSLPYVVRVCIQCMGTCYFRGCNAERRSFIISPHKTFEIECCWKAYPIVPAEHVNFHFCEIIYSEY